MAISRSVNHGSHYGFIENGVVFSRLQPGLATLFVRDDGKVEMTTWQEKDNALLPRVGHREQTACRSIEMDIASATAVPGRLVANWGAGDWSGSQDRKLRTMRSGVALRRFGRKAVSLLRGLLVGDPVGDGARVPGLPLPVHDAARHERARAHVPRVLPGRRPVGVVEYLMKGMREVDTTVSTSTKSVVRFIGYPDNRDFFYVTPRDERGTP